MLRVHQTAAIAYCDQLLGVDTSEPVQAGPACPLQAASGALEGEGRQVDVVQAASSVA